MLQRSKISIENIILSHKKALAERHIYFAPLGLSGCGNHFLQIFHPSGTFKT